MPYLVYKAPPFYNLLRRIVDPEEINDKFLEIARLVNDNIGPENIQGGRGFTLGMMQRQRALTCMQFQLDTTAAVAAWPTDGVLFKSAIALTIITVGVAVATVSPAFSANLKVGGVIKAVVTDTTSLMSFFTVNFSPILVAVNDVVALDVTAGSMTGTLTIMTTTDLTS